MRERTATSYPNRGRAVVLLAASSQNPVSQNHSSLSAFTHTRPTWSALPTPTQIQPISDFQAQHLPTCSCKCSWTRCVLSSDCTPDRYSIPRCEGKGGEGRVPPTEHPPLPATVLGALIRFPSSPPHANNKRLPCPSHG